MALDEQSARPHVPERLWRIRKRHQSIDAIVRPADDGTVHLQFMLNGNLIHSRRWPTRADADAAADAKLRELQRAGWATHW